MTSTTAKSSPLPQNQPASLWLRLQGFAPSWAVLVSLSVLAVFLGLLPFIARTWRATGDEPHYLLAAHSLVTDGDFDLANNYDNFDYLAFYFSRDINRQIVTNAAGQEILNHQLGLPVLIAPAYALAGRFGVLAFQAIVGAALAAITFKLAVFVSRDEQAAVLATLCALLTPPLFAYNYLVYPEMVGALLTTAVLYLALRRDQATVTAVILVLLALAMLPWLNRRYVPLALLLALFVAWSWRRRPEGSPSFPVKLAGYPVSVPRPTISGLLGLGVTLGSIALLFWFNSQLHEPARADIIAPADAQALWHRLARGGMGWLVDQQRGLLIFSPIYILALWGLPILLQESWQHKTRHWFVVMPFALSLGVTAVAGGYWIPWELGPRFLVVALPALTPLLALAWRAYSHRKIWTGAALVLFGLSIANTLVLIDNPELPYKSTLPAYYSQKLAMPLTEILPDLSGFARIFVTESDPDRHPTVIENGTPLWFAEAGRGRTVVQSPPLHQLPGGHYRLSWPVRIDPGLPPDTQIMRISANFLGGGPLFNQIVTAADLPPDGQFGTYEYFFINTSADRWLRPVVFHAVSTGESNIWGQDIIFAPNPLYAWYLPLLYLGLLAGGAGLAWVGMRSAPRRPAGPEPISRLPLSRKMGWSLSVLLPLLTVGYVIYETGQQSRTYQADALYHFVGRLAADPAAHAGQAWLVDPAVDPPQKAMHGPFDFYEPGAYQVTFRLKLLEAADPAQEVARLQVNATANLEPLVTQPILAKHFSRPDLYHDMVLTIDNPRRQALSFEVHYLGVAALLIDEVTITAVAR